MVDKFLELNDRMHAIQLEMRDGLSQIAARLDIYNEQLKIHIARTEQLEKRAAQTEVDMQVALKPIIWLTLTKSVAVWVTAIAGVLGAFWKIAEYLILKGAN
jgi:hypothetical protein